MAVINFTDCLDQICYFSMAFVVNLPAGVASRSISFRRSNVQGLYIRIALVRHALEGRCQLA